ncbi:MAG: peptide-methionine (S)-S-oxide reductase MsrA [Anaerolineaceae bacterium]|jgi:peptide-methionine (S)-S-oxide reductase
MTQTALFAGGCFWGVEARFTGVPGVLETLVGYAGGATEDPTYPEVCSDTTGHVECVLVTYDPNKTDYAELLNVFFDAHDPSLSLEECAAFGSQYRSVIFYGNPSEKQAAKKAIERLNCSGNFAQPVCTELRELCPFYPAEDYHQHYYARHGLPFGTSTF